MSRENLIRQAKQARARQAMLDQALRDSAQDLIWRRARKKNRAFSWWVGPNGQEADSKTLHRDREAFPGEEDGALVLALLDAGADINLPMTVVDMNMRPTHTTTLVNFLLKMGDYPLYPLSIELMGRGARLDDETAHWAGEYAASHWANDRSQKPHPWFVEIADRLLDVRGVAWDRSILDDARNRRTGYFRESGQGRIWLIHAIDRYYPGFIQRVKHAQEARGEPVFCLAALEHNISIDEKLRSVVDGTHYMSHEDRMESIRILMGQGADPCWNTKDSRTKHTALTWALSELDAPAIECLAKAGATTGIHFGAAVEAAIAKLESGHASKPIAQRFLDVVDVLIKRGGVIDLDQPVKWSEHNATTMSITARNDLAGQALEELLPEVMDPLEARLEAEALQKTTPARLQGVPRRI